MTCNSYKDKIAVVWRYGMAISVDVFNRSTAYWTFCTDSIYITKFENKRERSAKKEIYKVNFFPGDIRKKKNKLKEI